MLPKELYKFLDYFPDLLCILEIDGVIRFVSKSWTRLLGWKEEDLVSKSWLEFINEGDLDSARAIMEILKFEDVASFECRFRTKEGIWVWLSWAITHWREGLAVCIVRDISLVKATQIGSENIVRLTSNVEFIKEELRILRLRSLVILFIFIITLMMVVFVRV